MRILGADCGFKEFNFGMNQQRTSENHCADKEEILMPYLEAMANFREVVRNDLLPLLSLSPLQAGGFGQLPAGGFFFLFPPASRWLLPTASRGDSSFSSFPPASRWLRPTASRGVLLSLSPLQAGGFGQLPAGGYFFLFFPPASRWLLPTASRGGGASAGSAVKPFPPCETKNPHAFWPCGRICFNDTK
uniref:Uncharacterized protein n=1 Tax=Meloidogyne hapla TaxID=6305 RepID=A0A1I8BHR9_MELHA